MEILFPFGLLLFLAIRHNLYLSTKDIFNWSYLSISNVRLFTLDFYEKNVKMSNAYYLNGIKTIVLFSLLVSCKNDENVSSSSHHLMPDVIDFNYHVKPILSDKCFACHGPDLAKQKGKLRLDTKEGAYETKLESGGFPIVPGDLQNSAVYEKITSKDPELKMPPPESNLALSEYEIEIIEKWIAQGGRIQTALGIHQTGQITCPRSKR